MAETDKQDQTEDATPRRREEARERGQVALSAEVMAAGTLVAGLGSTIVVGGLVAASTAGLVTDTVFGLRFDPLAELSIQQVVAVCQTSARSAGGPVAFFILPLVVVVLLAGYAQVGLRVTPQALAWKPERLDPTKNVSKLFSARSAVRTFSALLKMLLIAGTMSTIAWLELPKIAALDGADLGPVLAGMGSVGLRCTIGAVVAIVVVAAADFGFQRWQHEKELRMTKKDLKDEFKNTEGDPQLKARIRQVQREMARSRMMAEVPKATVIITNPTHYAVALRYERADDVAQGRAPTVVAKGVDLVAQRIKAVARDADVPCYEDVALARALHAKVEIGDEVPEHYYQAVAGVLAYVYRLSKGRSALAGAEA